MKNPTCFDILQIPPDATAADARAAYMRLVKMWHPDRFADKPEVKEKAQEKLKDINVAYREVQSIIAARQGKGPARVFPKPPRSASTATVPSPRKPAASAFYGAVSSFFSHLMGGRLAALFQPKPSVSPRRGPVKRPSRPNAAPAAPPRQKDFQEIFNEAVQARTGRPAAPGKVRKAARPPRSVAGRPLRANGYRRSRAGRETGERVERVTPVRRVRRVGRVK